MKFWLTLTAQMVYLDKAISTGDSVKYMYAYCLPVKLAKYP